MTAPTAAEIREAVDKLVAHRESYAEPSNLVYDLSAAIRYTPPDEDTPETISAECLWDDLRPSQAARLAELHEEVYTKFDALIEQEVVARLREFVVEAAMTFAAEYPDAPRRAKPIPA